MRAGRASWWRWSGPSGAGKSTIAALVPRLYDVDRGAVELSRRGRAGPVFAALRGTVGVVTQDGHLFHDTIAANLRYAAPEASDAELADALRRARLGDLFDALPDGLETVVGERGYRLSGGERQRLTIARLLLARPRVVILDEATAHLDSESEVAVQAALAEALEGRTAIVIAHRLSTVRAADEIAVVEDGRVVERGTHDDLLAAGGATRRCTGRSSPSPAVRRVGRPSTTWPASCSNRSCDLVHLRAVGAEFGPDRGVELGTPRAARTAAPAERGSAVPDLTRRRRMLVLAICCSSLFIVGLDNTIVNLALPSIRRDLGSSLSGLQWVIDAYTLVLASLLMLGGSTGDRIGRRRTFQAGLTLFGVGSLLCSLAPTTGWLIAFRALQAIGGSMLNPVAMSIITNVFTDRAERAKAIGVWGGVIGLSMALGPLVGGGAGGRRGLAVGVLAERPGRSWPSSC